MASFMTLTAYCEQCDETSEVYADELFEFDCRCGACDALLVIQEEDEADEARPTVLFDPPTSADTEPELDPNDPYALAAQALDASVTARLGGPVTVEMPLPNLPPFEVEARGHAPGALDGLGEPPRADPLPSWDGGDTQQVDALAKQELLAGAQLPPLENLDTLADEVHDEQAIADEAEFVDDAEEALGELEVLHLDVGETAGRGSRTYEPTDLDEEFPTLVLPDSQNGAVPTGLASDLDWLALINDALPDDGELGDDDEPGKARVFIRVPEEMAPTDDADPEQVKRFQETMSQLEQGGSLEAMLSGPPVQRFDPEQTGKLTHITAEQEQEGHTAAWEQRLDVQTVEPGTPTPIGKAHTKDLPIPEIESGQDPTQAWPEKQRVASALAGNGNGDAAPRRPSARRPVPRTVIEQFQRSDLDVGLVCARDVGSPQADHFRRLYQRIFQAQNGSSPRVVMVTSPGADEGKTTVAANLAIVGARIPGSGALLVDADPRGRGVLRAFGQRQQFDGLLEALAAQRELSEYVVGFNLGTLDVVPLGLPGSDAVELLASSRMADFVASLRQAYTSSVVIIDACSLLHAALAPLVDGVIVVVRAGKTRREDVARTLEDLTPSKVLGVVLNDAMD